MPKDLEALLEKLCKFSANGYCVTHKSYAEKPSGPKCRKALIAQKGKDNG